MVDIGNGSLFSPLIQKIVARQSRKIEKTLSKTKIDVQIISHSKAGEIKGLLKQEHDTNKTVILMSGANMIVDFSQYLPETVLKAGGALLHNLDQDKIHQV